MQRDTDAAGSPEVPGETRLLPEDHIFFDGTTLRVLDQTELPLREVVLELKTADEVSAAIRRLAARGAMAIGVAGAYGVLLEAIAARDGSPEDVAEAARRGALTVGSSRPTARNLFWALERMEEALEEGHDDSSPVLVERLRAMADSVAIDTIETNRALVEAGQGVVDRGAGVLTHCNSGPLAALRYGTALGILIQAHREGKGIHVYVDETRPLLQGARLTTWELGREGVPYTLIPDGAAGVLMRRGDVDLVITGADRIAANGDAANKIGTFAVAVLACEHAVPFYIAAPGSTVDLACPTGEDIVIEQRDPDEVRMCGGRRVAPEGAPVFNPSFDVTPAGYIRGIITEAGVLSPPFSESLSTFAKA